MFILVAVALCYYGSYWRCGFLVSDEGSAALLSQRLLNGERPFRDLALGYNVMWFYPITAIFAAIGPNFMAMKAWFFVLSTVAAIFAFLGVRKFTGRDFPALLTALLVLFIPGSNYKTYIPMVVLANAACMLWAARRAADGQSWRFPLLMGGLALGMATLVRVDIGYPLAFVWAVTIPLLHIAQRGPRRVLGLLRDTGIVIGLAAALHLPFIAAAKAQGWSKDWAEHYSIVAKMYQQPFRAAFKKQKKKPASITAQATPIATATPKEQKAATAPKKKNADGWARVPLGDAWKAKKFRQKAWALVTYVPVVTVSVLMAAGAAIVLLGKTTRLRALGAGVAGTAAASLSTFPQFLMFRPDVPHLAEFMPGLLAAMAAGSWLFLSRSIEYPARILRIAAVAAAMLLLAHGALWGWYGITAAPAGGFLNRADCPERFQGENGVDVLVSDRQARWLRDIYQFASTQSEPGEYMVCYPYWPGLNFMCDRPTYEKNLYVDNLTSGKKWQDETLAEFARYQPAIVVINDWPVNADDASRFSNWAPRIVEHLEANFPGQAVSGPFRMFSSRPGTQAAPAAPASTDSY